MSFWSQPSSPTHGGNAQGNFNSRVFGAGDAELRAFVENNVSSTSVQAIVNRITQYFMYDHFYTGRHWKDFSENMVSFNYCRAFIDKIIAFVQGKEGVAFTVAAYDATEIESQAVKDAEKVILRNWNLNDRKRLMHEILLMGGVTGDVWVALTYNEEMDYVPFRVFDSRFSFPVFENGDWLEPMESFQYRRPLEYTKDTEYRVHVTQYTKDKIETWYQKNAKYSINSDNQELEKFEYVSKVNPYGFIPMVHIPNALKPADYYGTSDLVDVMKLNKIYNEMSQEVKSIIEYYGMPTTVITGANAKQLRRGLGNIWSGLPAEANVFNLSLDADLASTNQFLDQVKRSMHELSDVPENSLGQLQPVSNTSGAALELMYQPLIQKADAKRMTYGKGVEDINKMTIDILAKEQSSNAMFRALPKDFNKLYFVSPVFSYGFPKDRALELDMATKEIDNNLGSRKEWMEKLGKDNVEQLQKEIEADREEDMKYGNSNDDEKDDKDGDGDGKKGEGKKADVTPPKAPEAKA